MRETELLFQLEKVVIMFGIIMVAVGKEMSMIQDKKALFQRRKKLENTFFVGLLLFIGVLSYMTCENELPYYVQAHCV